MCSSDLKLLPNIELDSEIPLTSISYSSHFTEPPSRYSEATLIKTLENLGIGRPSTYAPTISLLANREYIKLEKKQIFAQESSFQVIGMLEKHFVEIVDSGFTASLEDKLDDISEGKFDWQKVLWEFYEPFIKKISDGKFTIESQKMAISTGEFCPQCKSEQIGRAHV